MDKILISYDLMYPIQDYDQLIARIKKFPYSEKVLYSQWIVKTRYSAAEVRDALLPHIDKANDKLLVVNMSQGGSAWYNISMPSWFKQKYSLT